jgi:type III secretion protein L
MYLFTLISGQAVALTEGEKIVPKKDFTIVKSAEEIVTQATDEAEKYRKQIEEDSLVIKEKAETEGFAEGLHKLNEQIALFEKLQKEIKEEMQEKMLPIVLSSVKKIIGQEIKTSPNKIVDIVMQALKPVIQHHHITIYVRKEDLKKLEAKKKTLKNLLQQVEVLSIQERADIEPGGCIIETEAGIINAQLENQIRSLETALKKFMGKKKR